jgi:rubrerythrin
MPADISASKLASILSYYRDAELHGARLLLLLHRAMRDADSQIKLTRHLADETRHAWLWSQRIAQLNAQPERIDDGYQRRLGERIGSPTSKIDLLALTIVAEERALERYREHAAFAGVDATTLDVLGQVTGDEVWHLSWVREKLDEVARASGDPALADRAIEKYRAIESAVYQGILDREAAIIAS